MVLRLGHAKQCVHRFSPPPPPPHHFASSLAPSCPRQPPCGFPLTSFAEHTWLLLFPVRISSGRLLMPSSSSTFLVCPCLIRVQLRFSLVYVSHHVRVFITGVCELHVVMVMLHNLGGRGVCGLKKSRSHIPVLVDDSIAGKAEPEKISRASPFTPS